MVAEESVCAADSASQGDDLPRSRGAERGLPSLRPSATSGPQAKRGPLPQNEGRRKGAGEDQGWWPGKTGGRSHSTGSFGDGVQGNSRKEWIMDFLGDPVLRIHLPRQGTQVQSLLWEESTGRMASKLSACALEPVLCNKRSHCNEDPVHHVWRKPEQSNEDPAQPKTDKQT